MLKITDIIEDIDRNCMIHNMMEDKFTYRVVFFVNDGNKSAKHYIDTTYGNLRKTLENIIRGNLSVTNSIVIARTTVMKNKQRVSLQSRSYTFCLNEYFDLLTGRCKTGSRRKNIMCNSYAEGQRAIMRIYNQVYM